MQTTTIVPLDSQTIAALTMDEDGIVDLAITYLRDTGDWRRIYISRDALAILSDVLGAAEEFAAKGMLLTGEMHFFGKNPGSEFQLKLRADNLPY